MALTYIDRFRPRERAEIQAAVDAGRLYKRDELELLEPEQLHPLAFLSVIMLLIGGTFFIVLNIASYMRLFGMVSFQISFWGMIWWLGLNIVGYILILPLHELLHGLAFLFWGGKPYFGAKLPLALYCGAKQQLFNRNYYLVVGLAPLFVITLLGILITCFMPALASYGLFAWIGNFSGAAGDVMVARKLLHLPSRLLVEDTEAGYRAWMITAEA